MSREVEISSPVGVPPIGVLSAAYRAFEDVVAHVDEGRSGLPSACAGWSVRDLVYHCLGDARRGLVALHTPTRREPDRDAVTYWRDWRPDPAAASDSTALPRAATTLLPSYSDLRDECLETFAALRHAAERVAPEIPVATQGHSLTAGDLLRTLAVEATIHHLDLQASLPGTPGPCREGLAEVRRTLDGLLGRPAPSAWDDAHYARAATGRAALSAADRAALGEDAPRFPLFV
ncbi:maleylpyruvate isomerase N-terminal domain-containing protein [Streptomyces sp. 549]|uniref:maleylpyruvate isomerase N-terminal domain-containing protein n=1 Tax=Streptomyces sp. 549 TaxID=3049076 RepID=UPI0024C47191|nr:maleylpyruvate isomerase family mycothiol-dependent enzyme [Streptomyces sp. 549]MDK1474617.1 maleylpyruvate isomerase N-terminal domain-containing protein [Streptomyces sp. 549]